MTLNSITNANRIRIGQVLIISGTSTAAASAPAASTPAASATSYTVVRGDTLSGIAARFGTTTRNLMTLNSITNANRIRVGQVLIISGTSTAAASAPAASTPAASATSYTVVRGDTLSGIAARFGTTTRNLMTLNGISNANLLRVGQVLRLA
jgi:lysozyme